MFLYASTSKKKGVSLYGGTNQGCVSLLACDFLKHIVHGQVAVVARLDENRKVPSALELPRYVHAEHARLHAVEAVEVARGDPADEDELGALARAVRVGGVHRILHLVEDNDSWSERGKEADATVGATKIPKSKRKAVRSNTGKKSKYWR